MIDHNKQGKANKAKGARWELKVRKHLESEGWIVSKFRCNIDITTGEIVQARNTFLPRRGMLLGSGFPDLIIFKSDSKVEFVECKLNGNLDNDEKLKLDWLVKKGFKCYVAQNEGKEIYYRKFVEYKQRDRIHRK